MTQQSFQDDDLVYVDPKSRKVIAKVAWDEQGLPKPLPVPTEEDPSTPLRASAGKRERRAQFYPWGTYRSMKHSFRVEGKRGETEEEKIGLDEALKKAAEEPFW